MTESKKQATEEERFSENVVCMIDVIGEIIEGLNKKGINVVSSALVSLAGNILKSFDKQTLIESFIKTSYKHWDLIKKRDRKYFVEHAQNIFAGINVDKITAFSKLFEEDKNGNIVINKEDEDSIADYFTSLVKISIKYIHRIRCPSKGKNGGIVYANDSFSYVDVAKEAKTWTVNLVV